jgi:hypothetical protein
LNNQPWGNSFIIGFRIYYLKNMPQSVTDLFGLGATLSNGVLTIDFKTAGRTDGVDTPSTITAPKAAAAILSKFASLTAANDDPTAAIAAQTTTTTPQYIATRGGTATTQIRESVTIYRFYASTNPIGDVDNLI